MRVAEYIDIDKDFENGSKLTDQKIYDILMNKAGIDF